MDKLKITIIAGSHRKTSESGKMAAYIKNILNTLAPFSGQFEPHILDLAQAHLPFFNDDPTEEEKIDFQTKWRPISQLLETSDALIVVSPEWNGMVPAQLKNLFLLINREVYHKPALIVTVSAGPNGHYPVVELRMSSYKNSRLLYLPEHLIVRNIQDFNQNPNNENFTEVRERLINDLHILYLYASRLKDIGKEILKLPFTEKYPHGL